MLSADCIQCNLILLDFNVQTYRIQVLAPYEEASVTKTVTRTTSLVERFGQSDIIFESSGVIVIIQSQFVRTLHGCMG